MTREESVLPEITDLGARKRSSVGLDKADVKYRTRATRNFDRYTSYTGICLSSSLVSI